MGKRERRGKSMRNEKPCRVISNDAFFPPSLFALTTANPPDSASYFREDALHAMGEHKNPLSRDALGGETAKNVITGLTTLLAYKKLTEYCNPYICFRGHLSPLEENPNKY